MSKRFDPKEYQEKERIYRAVPGTTMISRLLVWNVVKGEYTSPERGKVFDARRWEKSEQGGRRVRKAYFETLEEARAWQSHLLGDDGTLETSRITKTGAAIFDASADTEVKPTGPSFADVVAEFRQKAYPLRSRTTCLQYDKLLKLHFGSLMHLSVNDITPKVVDDWLWTLKRELKKSIMRDKRKSFEKELDLLQVILRHYEKYNDDNQFRCPIKQRHRDDMWVVRKEGHKDRDLPREQFNLVREKLRRKRGDLWWALFTLQWSAALRISEAAALHWEDVSLNWREPAKSSITVCRHVEWPRMKGQKTLITPGFKNSKGLGGKKVIPLFPEAFEALKTLFHLGAKGLVFPGTHGQVLEYRQIQARYVEAFAAAGIEYQGTHALRHGGCRDLYNETGGDLATAGHLLGNEDSDTVKTYAKRDRSALFKVNERRWASLRDDVENVGQ